MTPVLGDGREKASTDGKGIGATEGSTAPTRATQTVAPARVRIPAAAVRAGAREADRSRPASRPAAERRAGRRERRATDQAAVEKARAKARDAVSMRNSAPGPVAAPQRDGDPPASLVGTALVAALAAAGGLFARLRRRRGGEAAASLASPLPYAPVDRLEAELQAMLDGQRLRAPSEAPELVSEAAVPADASEAQCDDETGKGSSMATNSA